MGFLEPDGGHGGGDGENQIGMAYKFKTLDELDPAGKRVMVRVDLNVPVRGGQVTDASRIERIIPTLQELRERKGRVIVASHFGRPRGRIVREMSLRVVLRPLQGLLGSQVAFADDCIGPPAAMVVNRLKDGEVALLENLRFHGGEERNDPGTLRKGRILKKSPVIQSILRLKR